MKFSSIIILATLSFLNIPGAFAESAGLVEGLQMPAWLERGASKLPLKAGMNLQSGDKVLTGANARVLLKLEEGSHVKMGQNARINLDRINPPKKPSGIFSGFIKVVKGAFRFTTSKIGQSRRRNIDFRIGTITAGIRGTDIWGRSNNEKDLVCLIEGKINVNAEGKDVALSDPLSFFVKPKNAPADPVGAVSAEQLGKWAKQTDLEQGAGVVSSEGNYFINLMSVSSQQLAETNLKRFHQAGFAADIETADVAGKAWYRLRINGLSSKADAQKLAETLRAQFNLDGAWIDRT